MYMVRMAGYDAVGRRKGRHNLYGFAASGYTRLALSFK